MKKFLSIFLSVLMLFAFIACDEPDPTPTPTPTPGGGNEDEPVVYTIKAAKTSIFAGETLQLTLEPACEGTEWYSSKPKVATVDATTGLLTAVAPGSTIITAVDANFETLATITITVDKTWKDKVSEAEAAGTAISLVALNCKDNLALTEDGILTNMAKEGAISNTDDAYAYAVYPVTITEDSNVTIEAKIKYLATSNTNGTALILHNGKTVTAYRAGTDQGMKNVKVDPNCTDMKKTGGNGYSYNSGAGYSSADLLSGEVLAKTVVANGQASVSYYTVDGANLIASKAHSFSDYFVDGAVVNLAIGGKTTEHMEVREIYIIEDGVRKLVTKIDNSGLAGLNVETTSLRINLDASSVVDVAAVNAGGVPAQVIAESADTTKVTVSVADPDENGVSKVTLTGVGVGSTTITVTHKDSPNLTRSIQVSVDDFTDEDPYTAENIKSYPAIGSTDAPVDGYYRLDFDAAPTLLAGGAIMIFADNGELVDTILFEDEKLTVWDGVSLNVRDQLVYVKDNSLYFMPHYGVLDYATKYFIAIPRAGIAGKIDGKDFYENGLSNASKTWSFTTRDAPTATTTVSVDSAESSEADYRTIQAALIASKDSSSPVTINVAAGTYTELIYYKGKADIVIAGPDQNNRGDDCLITWNNYEKMNSGTHNRAQFYYNGSNLTLKNLSFVNKFRRSATEQDGQAECIYFAGGKDKKLVVYNCSFLSYQDTIQSTGRNWFYDCYIAGDVDFLWGTADAALFENCDLHTLNDDIRGTKTADLLVPRVATLDSTIIPKGYVVFNCKFTVDEGINQSFGRVAGAGNFYDQCAVINTDVVGAGVISTIWNNGSEPTGLAKVDGVQHVGWKDYGNTVNGVAMDESGRRSHDYCGTITKEVYDAEYSSRDVILNRVYNKNTNSYETSANGVWDLSGYYAEFDITE